MKNLAAALFIAISGLFSAPAQAISLAWNLHQIERNNETGYAVYRYGLPGRLGVLELCARGVTEVMVLSGNAQEHEWRYKKWCPGLKVIYNVKQDPNVALSGEFLEFFDKWVEKARAEGRKIAFRCTCGCHRTGRLAAYYQMKYQGLTAPQALKEMDRLGYFMWMYPHLRPQVLALQDHIIGRPCGQSPNYCVAL